MLQGSSCVTPHAGEFWRDDGPKDSAFGEPRSNAPFSTFVSCVSTCYYRRACPQDRYQPASRRGSRVLTRVSHAKANCTHSGYPLGRYTCITADSHAFRVWSARLNIYATPNLADSRLSPNAVRLIRTLPVVTKSIASPATSCSAK